MLIIDPDILMTRRVTMHMLIDTENKTAEPYKTFRQLLEAVMEKPCQPIYLVIGNRVMRFHTLAEDLDVQRQVLDLIDLAREG